MRGAPPSGILNNHAENQLSEAFADALPAEGRLVARDPVPIQGNPARCSVPGLGSDDCPEPASIVATGACGNPKAVDQWLRAYYSPITPGPAPAFSSAS